MNKIIIEKVLGLFNTSSVESIEIKVNKINKGQSILLNRILKSGLNVEVSAESATTDSKMVYHIKICK